MLRKMIRKANIEDIPAINKLGNLVLSNFSQTYNLNSYLKDNKYLILVDDQQTIKGMLIILNNIDTYELEMIVVDPSFRNMGIGKSLINYFLENYYDKNKEIYLEVAANNENAINFYKKMGFELSNIRKKYYKEIDAYIMKKVNK